MKLTKAQLEDIKKRVDSFIEEYESLAEKYQVDFMAGPVYIAKPDGTYTTVVRVEPQDKKYRPIMSPIQTSME